MQIQNTKETGSTKGKFHLSGVPINESRLYKEDHDQVDKLQKLNVECRFVGTADSRQLWNVRVCFWDYSIFQRGLKGITWKKVWLVKKCPNFNVLKILILHNFYAWIILFCLHRKNYQVDPTGEYKDIVYIRKFEDTFTHCGGVNLPKVVTCVCSDGQRRRQLIKVQFFLLTFSTILYIYISMWSF